MERHKINLKFVANWQESFIFKARVRVRAIYSRIIVRAIYSRIIVRSIYSKARVTQR